MENNKKYTFKGVVLIGSSPYAYTAQGFLKPDYRAEIEECSLCLRRAEGADMNSPGIQEVNDIVLNIISNSSGYNPLMLAYGNKDDKGIGF